MLIYRFNRPYDDQSQVRIRLETEAKLSLQDKVRNGACQLVWSSILDLENSRTFAFRHSHVCGNPVV